MFFLETMKLKIDITDLVSLYNKVEILSIRVDELFAEYLRLKELIDDIRHGNKNNN